MRPRWRVVLALAAVLLSLAPAVALAGARSEFGTVAVMTPGPGSEGWSITPGDVGAAGKSGRFVVKDRTVTGVFVGAISGPFSSTFGTNVPRSTPGPRCLAFRLTSSSRSRVRRRRLAEARGALGLDAQKFQECPSTQGRHRRRPRPGEVGAGGAPDWGCSDAAGRERGAGGRRHARQGATLSPCLLSNHRTGTSLGRRGCAAGMPRSKGHVSASMTWSAYCRTVRRSIASSPTASRT